MIAALAVALVAYNTAANLWLPDRAWGRWYVPLNAAATAALLAVGRARLSWSELGFSTGSVAPGVAWGAGIAVLALAGLAVGGRLTPLQRLYEDQRVSGLTSTQIRFYTLVRIPVGTALFEEVAFRGVLFGLWQAAASTTGAVIGTSLVFGLWHIGPTYAGLRINGVGTGWGDRWPLVAGAVVVTAVAGVGFALLRLATGGLVGPVLAHWAFNSLGAWAAWRRQQAGR